MTYSVGPTSTISSPNRYYSSTQNINIEDSSLGLNDFELVSLEVYPNPAKTIINFKSNVKITMVSVYNILGQRLKALTMNNSSGNINIRDLANGIYLIKFETNDGDKSVTKRILKN